MVDLFCSDHVICAVMGWKAMPTKKLCRNIE